MKKKYTFFQNIPFLCKFQKQPALAEEAPVVSTTLSIPFSGPAERSLYFTENPDFTAPSAGIHSRRFPGSRIFLYSSDPEHDLAAVPSSLFDVLHRYFAVHSPDDVVLWKNGILSFQTMENQPQPLTALVHRMMHGIPKSFRSPHCQNGSAFRSNCYLTQPAGA